MDKLIERCEKVPQHSRQYKLAEWFRGYRDALILKRDDIGYRITPADGWNPSPYEAEREYLMPYRDELIKILEEL